uniref:Ion transport domain-containing protein n=1 Tax=Lotharella oceanica TaxID=641309 RepID=A0A7S2X8G7_9EUKA|mmetsp:Transcript_17543/g.33291  ORF Transcript_17543/g.33291 Transcript_17543/m.33291 type:complete len:195 (+) Transcript_17543:84-668(+)
MPDWSHDFATATKRLYYSEQCASAYLILIAINIGMICWTLSLPGGYDGGTLFLMAQMTLNAILVCEVLVRYIGSPENFWGEWSNVFDVFVMILAVATQLLYMADPKDYDMAEEGAIGVRIVRDGFQFLRLGVFMKNRTKSEPYQLVDFKSVDEFGTVPVRFANDPLLDEACGELSEPDEESASADASSHSSSDF